MISFSVYGIPVAQGSKRAMLHRATGRAILIESNNERTRSWRQDVASSARDALTGPMLEGPVSVQVEFYFPRPKGHSGAKGLKASAPPFPASKPDIDKCVRAILDALQGTIVKDDSQVVWLMARKFYANPERMLSVGARVYIDTVVGV